MQTKKQSLVEQVVKVGTGFIIAQAMILYLIPYWDTTSLTLVDSMTISFIFTIVSLARGFIFRLYFNRVHSKDNK